MDLFFTDEFFYCGMIIVLFRQISCARVVNHAIIQLSTQKPPPI